MYFYLDDIAADISVSRSSVIPSLVDGIVFTGLSDVIFALLFVAAVSLFVVCVEFQVGVLAPEKFRWQIFPCEDLQRVVEFGVLVFTVLFHLHEKSLEIHR